MAEIEDSGIEAYPNSRETKVQALLDVAAVVLETGLGVVQLHGRDGLVVIVGTSDAVMAMLRDCAGAIADQMERADAMRNGGGLQ